MASRLLLDKKFIPFQPSAFQTFQENGPFGSDKLLDAFKKDLGSREPKKRRRPPGKRRGKNDVIQGRLVMLPPTAVTWADNFYPDPRMRRSGYVIHAMPVR